MRHAPDALLICNQHKAVPVSEAIRRFEVVSVAFDVVRLAIAILVPQQCQMSRLLLRNNDIVVGKNQQSTRMLEANDKWCCGKALHHARRLPRIWDHQGSAGRDWTTFWRRQVFRLYEKASTQLLVGIASGIRAYRFRGTAVLSRGHGSKSPRSLYGNCDYANVVSHGILLSLPRVPSRAARRESETIRSSAI